MFKKIESFIPALAIVLAGSCFPARTRPPTPLPGRLEKIRLSDLDGRPFTLQRMAGKAVFLNFWATWCRPCVSELQSIEAVHREFNRDIVFLAVSTEDPALVRNFLETNKFSFQFARLDMAYIDAYVVTMPTTLLIDASGRLIAEEEGFRIWTDPANRQKLRSLAGSK